MAATASYFQRAMQQMRSAWDMPALRPARKVIVAVVGVTIILIGLALIVLPGPAFIVIPAGLAVLALEFEWARQWLNKLKESARYVTRSRSKVASATTARQ